jgi:hypothetical protein
MGKNTPERQEFIIENLRVEEDIAVELAQSGQQSDEQLEIAS